MTDESKETIKRILNERYLSLCSLIAVSKQKRYPLKAINLEIDRIVKAREEVLAIPATKKK